LNLFLFSVFSLMTTVARAVCGHREAMHDPFAAHFASKAWWYARGQLPCFQELVATQQVLRYFGLGYSRSLTRDLGMTVFGVRDWLSECSERGLNDDMMAAEIDWLLHLRYEREQNAMEDAWYNRH